ncbi:IS3 family transposase [Clostridium weizhouense]|uniref:IS3 family transposase n=1 Tax=Clostridium weizhouense TaxID=2859781 RepID=UPI0027E43F18|nr:IS3 family transposase [Clostridium weizhouense]
MIEGLVKAKRAYYNRCNRIADYELIKELHESDEQWNISFMCEHLNISRAAYYKWINSTPSERQIEDERILAQIKEISVSNNSLFGAMNMYYKLRDKYYFTCGHNRVYRIMCVNDIRSSYRRTSSYKYIKSTHKETVENKLGRKFNSDKPNEKWCTDVTEIKVPTTGEKLYISPILDLYDRYPVGFAVSETNDTALTDAALEMAHNTYPEANPLYHSDRGFQYTRAVFKTKLKSYGMTQSMSRISRCIDNGPCEGFQGLFKDILFILYPEIHTKEEMIRAIYGTLDYYINEYPQKRFKGKTCGQVRTKALQSAKPKVYPIKQANRYIKFWREIEEKKQKVLQQAI